MAYFSEMVFLCFSQTPGPPSRDAETGGQSGARDGTELPRGVWLSPWPLSWAASLSLTPLNGYYFGPMSSPGWVRPGIPDVYREPVAAAGAPKALHR